MDHQREAVLVAYLQDMKDLIYSEGLRTSKSGDEDRVVARAQTLVTLRQIDGKRKGIAIQFLSEANLLTTPDSISDVIISLNGANLSGADLSKARLVV